MTQVFRKKRPVLNMQFFMSCQTDVEKRQLFQLKLPFIKKDVSQFNTSQKRFNFYEIFKETFYTDVKTIERIKKQSMFERNMADFKGK